MPRSSETIAQKIKRLEKEIENAKLRDELLDYMVDDIDTHYGTSLRKKFSAEWPEYSKNTKSGR